MNSDITIDSQQPNHDELSNALVHTEQTFLDAQLAFAKSKYNRQIKRKKRSYKKHWQAGSGGNNDRR
ncbi:hypothetical protein [Psychrobacter urativorans]|uniref:hypothetical protein n=1 Tax=Psychrobacter urativorans TaxID=45610 RepID=UPI0019190878|nr:hypothetical protein [Psychrobacter urativorans]